MITLYHGTSGFNGEKILHDCKIEVTSGENTQHDDCSEDYKTDLGYVYLASTYNKAISFGKSACYKTKKRGDWNGNCLYVFEVKLDESNLVPDKSECKMKREFWGKDLNCNPCDAENCIKAIQCTRYPEDIILTNTNTRYRIVKDDKNDTLVQDWTSI